MAEKTLSKLATLNAQWVANGSKTPKTEEARKLVQTMVAARKAQDAAADALEAARVKASEAASACILALGSRSIEIGGVKYEPSCRGDAVFYKAMNDKEALKF